MNKINSSANRKTVHVGITGHRCLASKNLEWLQDQIRTVLSCVKEALTTTESPPGSRLMFEGETQLSLISPLARGADQLVAAEALKLGYDLQCPLPFTTSETAKAYRDDVTDIANRFDSLLGQASVVTELDGSPQDSRSAYESVGRFVLQQSDLILAVWDGLDSGKTGGTKWTFQLALMDGIPVIVIPSDPEIGQPIKLLFSDQDHALTDIPLVEMEKALRDLLLS